MLGNTIVYAQDIKTLLDKKLLKADVSFKNFCYYLDLVKNSEKEKRQSLYRVCEA